MNQAGSVSSSTAHSQSNAQQQHRLVGLDDGQVFLTNRISTAKYNLLTFTFKFLYEQFRKYGNVFFLIICLLQQIPNVSPTGRFTTLVPFIIILTVSAIKEIFEDIKRHRADHGVNRTKTQVLNKHTHKFESKTWEEVRVGDIVKSTNGKFFPSDLLLISSSEPNGMCYIETANLDGETNLKIRQSLNATYKYVTPESVINNLKAAKIEYEPPNSHLYEFKGSLRLDGKVYPINPDQVLLRGAKLKNTTWTYGWVLYTGHETKLMLNSMLKSPLKQSNVEKLTNVQMLYLLGILLSIGFISAVFSAIWNASNRPWYLAEFRDLSSSFGFTFLTFVILYNNLIPISLQITLEIVRFIQAQFINWDLEMYCKENDTPAVARTSNLNEELGQVGYILSDKTGTLTCNVMKFQQCSIAGRVYTENEYNQIVNDLNANTPNSIYIKEFLTLMSVCHTVVPERKSNELVEESCSTFESADTSDQFVNNENKSPNQPAKNSKYKRERSKSYEITYQAASPDESALVKGACQIGYVFTTRTPKYVFINALNQQERYEILNVVEFTSDRKRMSVIVRCPDNSIKIYVKGADTVIYERLSNKKFAEENIEHLQKFAELGFRTLCLAYAEMAEKEYEQWLKEYEKALTAEVSLREKRVAEVIEKVEKNLTLLGSTAIEDKLQDGVPEAIEILHQAGIRLWILTGDKQETAINIGYSCKLLKPNLPIYLINDTSVKDIKVTIANYLQNQDSEASLVIDGHSLKFALDKRVQNDFLKIALACSSVICCRVSPMQKADIVNLVKTHRLHGRRAITLAIGDGANDVAMIRAAHVGIGISGNEGLQAAHSADYSISQFRFLVRLLLVHGSWSMTRLCKLILYSFYKNIALYVIELWFAILSAWSGQTIFERWTIALYNVLFTMAPPLAIGIFERQCSSETMIKYPKLYQQHHDNFNTRIFWIWVFGAIIHSLSLFWLTYFAVSNDTLWSNGLSDGGYLMFGNMLYTYVVITVCLKAGLEISSWTFVTHLTIWGSILAWIIYLLIYSRFWPILPIAAEMAGIDSLLFSSPVFWLGLVIPFITLFPDLCYIVIKKTCFKTLTDVIIEDENASNSSQQTLFSETARLIQSFCNPSAARRTPQPTTTATNIENQPSTSACSDQRKSIKSRPTSSASERRGSKISVKQLMDRNRSDSVKSGSIKDDVELKLGYAFSQEEKGVVSQEQFIRFDRSYKEL